MLWVWIWWGLGALSTRTSIIAGLNGNQRLSNQAARFAIICALVVLALIARQELA